MCDDIHQSQDVTVSEQEMPWTVHVIKKKQNKKHPKSISKLEGKKKAYFQKARRKHLKIMLVKN